MSGLYTLALREDYEPSKDGGYHEAFLVHADTERKAWTVVQRHVKGEEAGAYDKPDDWLKSSQRVVFAHIGEAEEGVDLGILLVSYVHEA